MLIHAKSGGDIEVMGSLQGKIKGDTIIVSGFPGRAVLMSQSDHGHIHPTRRGN